MKHYWTTACPKVAPDYGYMCRKPSGHAGLCEAGFCGGFTIPFVGEVGRYPPLPITITEHEADVFGVDVSGLQEADV